MPSLQTVERGKDIMNRWEVQREREREREREERKTEDEKRKKMAEAGREIDSRDSPLSSE